MHVVDMHVVALLDSEWSVELLWEVLELSSIGMPARTDPPLRMELVLVRRGWSSCSCAALRMHALRMELMLTL
jgi:hypothetical protein